VTEPFRRRQPPPFRRVEVARVAPRTPRLVRITLAGPELDGLELGLPAASVRLLLPSPGGGDVVVPTWDGNEFLLDDGSRPALRTLTPLRLDPDGHELDVEVVGHGDGPLARWAATAQPGDRAAVSGTGRGYDIDPTASAFLVAGDESALPAISTLLPALPVEADVQVLVEVAAPDGRLPLPDHPGARVRWLDLPPGAPPGQALVDAVTEADLAADVRVWAAGEAAAVQQIRRHLFEERDLPRSHATIRGYWKHGRRGAGSE
jgi:NADPH-dependent ferric siderophore reductase